MKKLSKREKIMVGLLVLIAVVAGSIYLVITPINEQHTELQDEIALLEQTKVEYIGRIAAKNKAQLDIEVLTGELTEMQDVFAESMSNGQLTIMLNEQMDKYNLKGSSISISGEQVITLSTYGTLAASEKVKVKTVRASFTGLLSDFVDFADQLSQSTSIKLMSFSQKINDDGESLSYSVELAVYMPA